MKKKLIALFLIFAMLVPLTPAVAADKAEPRPTVDEILNEHHQKAFEIDMANKASSSTYSMRSIQTKDELIQETVNALNSAGYEAYHVTPDNYDSLETQMRTDFAGMGLEPDGSYIIVISGEDSDGASSNTRANPILPIYPPGYGDGPTFTYTYQGIPYVMRYVTVLPTYGIGYIKSDSINVYTEFGVDILSNLDDAIYFAILQYITGSAIYGTILSILGYSPSDEYTAGNNPVIFYAEARWTRKFIQVKVDETNQWFNGCMVEYVDIETHSTGTVFNITTGTSEELDPTPVTTRRYSAYYNDTAQQKLDAINGYLRSQIRVHDTGNVVFSYQGSVFMRLNETFSYSP